MTPPGAASQYLQELSPGTNRRDQVFGKRPSNTGELDIHHEFTYPRDLAKRPSNTGELDIHPEFTYPRDLAKDRVTLVT